MGCRIESIDLIFISKKISFTISSLYFLFDSYMILYLFFSSVRYKNRFVYPSNANCSPVNTDNILVFKFHASLIYGPYKQKHRTVFSVYYLNCFQDLPTFILSPFFLGLSVCFALKSFFFSPCRYLLVYTS